MRHLRLTLACLLASTGAVAVPEEPLSTEQTDSEWRDSTNPSELGVLDVVCAGTQSTHYTPGLTFTPREVTTVSTGVLSRCVSLAYPTLVSGTFDPYSGTSVQSCLLSNPKFTKTVRWNTGHFSTYSVTSIVNAKPDGTSVIISTGEVTAGLFKGARVEQVIVLANTALVACATEPGTTAVEGPVTLTITP
jgi:hypothetical protein